MLRLGSVAIVAISFVLFGTGGPLRTSAISAAEPNANDAGWKPLVGQWKTCNFGGEGPVKIDSSRIRLGYGDPLTGIRWSGDFPRDSFEIRLEARRTDGHDFFCGLTFPVGEGKCSLILGGWGGGVVGLSSIDGEDASSNETTQFKVFDNDTWYKVKVRVTPEKVVAYLDDKVWVDQERGNHHFDIRIEMDPTLPLGIANFQCQSELRGLQWRKLDADGNPVAGAESGGKASSSPKSPKPSDEAEPSKDGGKASGDEGDS